MVDTLLHFLAHGLVVIVHRTARHGNLSISRMEMGSHSMATGVIDRYCSCFLRGIQEYTFAMNNQYHGIVAVKIENGQIISWREYQYQSTLDWKTFAGESEFETVR